MHRQPAMRLGATTLLLAAGLATALALQPAPASAYTITQIPNMGFGVTFIYLGGNCHRYLVGWRNDPKTDLGSDCDPGFQQKLDAFMASHCPPYVCPENAPTTATVTTTETDVQVTTAPPPDPVTTTVASTTTVTVQVTAPDNDPAPPADSDPKPLSAPPAGFQVSRDGLNVTAAYTASDASVTWSFGDGANAAGPTVSHTYAQPGSYVIVEAVVSADGLAAQAAQTVTVERPAAIAGRFSP